MKRLCGSGVILAGLLCLAGCRGSAPAPASPDTARQALEQALSAWTQGSPVGDLEKQDPPIYFNEPEWRAGKRLMRYQLKGDLQPFGRQLKGTVLLSFKDGQGKAEEREVRYQIDTHDVVVITRDF
jgi:hypothetical protein